MKINIKTFGITKEIIGESELLLDIQDNVSVSSLMDSLKEKYPQLNDLSSILMAVNAEYAAPNMILNNNDEVALIPPVSGG